ncbi:PEFG-CTERM sorting domain-containing protein [Nitrosopumilus maritimus]|nr:PEFG-CTERM sorting domain-containing protein [Nitrosopumilus maritimus]
MKNTSKKLQNTSDRILRFFVITFAMLACSTLVGLSSAYAADVQVTKIHPMPVEDDKVSVAFTLCSNDEYLEMPRITVSSDLQTKILSLKHDLKPGTCIGGTTIAETYDVSTINTSIVPQTDSNLYKQETIVDQKIVSQGMSNDGYLVVKLISEQPREGISMKFNLEFQDVAGNIVEKINYDITALQDNHVVLNLQNMHSSYGTSILTTDELTSDSPVEVNIMLHGIGVPGHEDQWTGPKGEIIMFHVVPEFGAIVMLVLTVSVLSIILISSKFNTLRISNIQS